MEILNTTLMDLDFGNVSHTVRLYSRIDHVKASNVEGAPFAEFYTTGNTGRFVGFMACFIQASFTIAGKIKPHGLAIL